MCLHAICFDLKVFVVLLGCLVVVEIQIMARQYLTVDKKFKIKSDSFFSKSNSYGNWNYERIKV